MVDRLSHLRCQIDTLDQQLLELLNQRAQVATQIGEIKKQTESAVFHPQREQQVIQNLVAGNQGPLTEPSIKAIWREVMSACRSLEQQVEVAFLGPQGSYSQEAALNYFGSSVMLQPCPDMPSVFKAVENGNCHYGVVAIENSTEGVVTQALDLLQTTPLKIIGEVRLQIKHALLRKEASLDNIDVVYAHPQALAQCQQWLSKNLPNAKRQAVASNSLGAQLAAENSNAAAIASQRAADTYGLHVLVKNIQDFSNNRTRFVVLAPDHEPQQVYSKDKAVCTSLVVSVPNRPGAVYDLLAPLKEHQVSLSRLESRPAKSDQWEYFFYIDIEGHIEQPSVAAAVSDVRRMCTFFKFLGSYPIEQETSSCSSDLA